MDPEESAVEIFIDEPAELCFLALLHRHLLHRVAVTSPSQSDSTPPTALLRKLAREQVVVSIAPQVEHVPSSAGQTTGSPSFMLHLIKTPMTIGKLDLRTVLRQVLVERD